MIQYLFLSATTLDVTLMSEDSKHKRLAHNAPEKESPTLTIDELANRRQYFRIEDKAVVEVSPLEEGVSPGESFELSPEFSLISEFQLLDVESKHLLRSITDKDKSLGQFLRVMNKKLDSLSRVVALTHQNSTQNDTTQAQDVNLSEGGIALQSGIEYQAQQRVAIKLILLPMYSGLILEGEILSCRGSSAPYELHIAFTDICEAHQQLIARHIMRLQSQQIHKNQRNQDSE